MELNLLCLHPLLSLPLTSKFPVKLSRSAGLCGRLLRGLSRSSTLSEGWGLSLPSAAGWTGGQGREYRSYVDLFTSLVWPVVGPSWGSGGEKQPWLGFILASRGRTPEYWLSTSQTLCQEGRVWYIPRQEKKELLRQVSGEDRGEGGWIWGYSRDKHSLSLEWDDYLL